jgi:hypothetical protein
LKFLLLDKEGQVGLKDTTFISVLKCLATVLSFLFYFCFFRPAAKKMFKNRKDDVYRYVERGKS